MLDGAEVAKHNSRDSCWVIVHGKAYDVTKYIDRHPGGAEAILRYAGKDATEEYDKIHAEGTIEGALTEDKHLGDVDPTTIIKPTKSQSNRAEGKDPIPISMCLSVNDIELAASKSLPRDAWAYFHSASDNLGAERNNRVDWTKIILRPRVLRNVQRVDMTQTIMGQRSALPFFVAPAARAKMAHPEGEYCIVRGVARAGIPYCTSTVSSISHVDLAKVLGEETQTLKLDKGAVDGCLFFQLYAAIDPAETDARIQTAIDLGFKALVLTVDSAVVSKREEAERHLAEREWTDSRKIIDTAKWIRQFDDPTLSVLRGHHSCTLDWTEVKRLKELWARNTVNGPFAIKGIQTVEDAVMAVEEAGVSVIYLSNHGGRQCDDAPSAIRTLLEIRKFAPHLLDKAEFYLDGGIRRGADIVKAIALGAKGVAMGRPFMYALGAYGTEGVERVIKILREEIETTMRLTGVTRLDQLNPSYVDTTILERDLPQQLYTENGILKAKL